MRHQLDAALLLVGRRIYVDVQESLGLDDGDLFFVDLPLIILRERRCAFARFTNRATYLG
ncbi:hypothetical protein G6O69_30525 [Pseudenhygromyxa sp. WMMC2535]|nr:hypothetical protein [Pseudenhygromyxa sp. WMMC2535]